MTLLVGSSTGPIISSGSNVELIVDKHPLLASLFICFDYRATLTPNVSVLVSHCNLSALSIGSLSKSRLLTVLSSAVMADNTSFTLETNFVRWSVPFRNNCISCSDALIAHSVVGTENKQSSTHKFLDTTKHTSFPNSGLWSVAVLFRAQAVTQGESAFTNKCTVFLWSLASSSILSLHHRHLSSFAQATLKQHSNEWVIQLGTL